MLHFLRHRRAFSALLAALGASLVGATGRAEPCNLWLGGTAVVPIEQRIAVAVGPTRTTLWTSLRLSAEAGAVGLVLPIPEGASVDRSSDAWFEALEVATAPRVFPPIGAASSCDGQSSPSAFSVEGTTTHEASLEPDELALLKDASAVEAWASQHGLTVAEATKSALQTSEGEGERFLVARFTTPGGARSTPTLRITLAGQSSIVPLALLRAGEAELTVTAWALGPGRASHPDGPVVSVAAADVLWSAATGQTTYRQARAAALIDAGPTATLVEASSHGSLGEELAIAAGTARIESVVEAYYARAIGYGDGDGEAEACTMMAASVLTSSSPIAMSCARNDLGGVLPGDPCVEAPVAGEIDPAKLRCGPKADDLAIALSGAAPASVWLTRHTMLVAPNQTSVDRMLSWSDGPVVTPTVVAGSVDATGCGTGGAGGGGVGGAGGAGVGGADASGAGGTGGTVGATPGPRPSPYVDDPRPTNDVIVDTSAGAVGCGCNGTADTAEDSYADGESEGCGSDSSDTSSDTSTDDCAGDSSDTSSDTSTDDCAGDSSDTGTDSSGSTDTGDSGGDGCASDSSDEDSDCSVRRGAARSMRLPRLSAMTFLALLFLLPLRRMGRR